jgi:tetratricopeptide (TPR) repeat protein
LVKPPRVGQAIKPPSPVDTLLRQAISALRERRAEAAEQLAAGVLKANRDNLLAAQILGEALLLQGRPAEAAEVLAGPARKSRDAATETLLAMALAAAGRKDEALDQLRRATTRRPAFPLAFLELGDRLGEGGQFAEAISVLEKGLSLVPDAEILRLALGYIHLKGNDRAKARQLFAAVAAAAPDHYSALMALAKVMAMEGDDAGAADIYQRLLASRPNDAAARIALGKCLLEQGAREAGEAMLRSAVEGDAQRAKLAIAALAATPHGRFFLRPSAAAKFMGVGAE